MYVNFRLMQGTIVTALVLLGACGNAEASVVSTFSIDPGTISEGQQSTLDLTLNLYTDPGQNLYAYFTGGSATLYSGTGLSENFTIPYGGTSVDFQYSFTYPTAGDYTVSFSYTSEYDEEYYYYYSFFTRNDWWYGMNSYGPSGQGSGTLTVNALVDPQVTPLPAALPLFATGLGALGLFGWRRKRKNIVAVAVA
jgi:hypothetical protein